MDESLPKIQSAPIAVIAVALKGMSREPWREAAWREFVSRSPAGSQLIFIDPDRGIVNLTRGDSSPQPAAGLGNALQSAALSVSTPLVLFIPADNSFAPGAVASLRATIDDAHLVIGCRRTGPIPFMVLCRDLAGSIASRIFLGYVPEPRCAWPGWTGWCRRLVARRLFGVPLLDPESNIILARREIFERIPLQSLGTFAYVEMIAKANHLGCKLAEVGVDGRAYPTENFAADARRVFRSPDFGPPPR